MFKRISILLLLATANTSQADSIFVQTTDKIPLVEVYTSEGCSSCPPADRWLSSLVNHPKLFKAFVPIAFHVSYWDYIGHKDRFADESANQRQRNHASRINSRNVYTPELFIAGKETRGWNTKILDSKIEKGSSLKIIKKDNGVFEAITEHKNATVHIAQLSFSQITKPKRGENAGVELIHDFVISQWTTKSLTPNRETKSAVIAWIEDEKGIPIQAVGSWLKQKTSY